MQTSDQLDEFDSYTILCSCLVILELLNGIYTSLKVGAIQLVLLLSSIPTLSFPVVLLPPFNHFVSFRRNALICIILNFGSRHEGCIEFKIKFPQFTGTNSSFISSYSTSFRRRLLFSWNSRNCCEYHDRFWHLLCRRSAIHQSKPVWFEILFAVVIFRFTDTGGYAGNKCSILNRFTLF